VRVVMDHGWIVTLADPHRPDVQINLMTHDAHRAGRPGDVGAGRRRRRGLRPGPQDGAEIVHELTDEPWGVRRFFVRDPDGNVLNVLAHQKEG
jgi:catechol 2,3-dioxygenase-like lactoylglutathione lyase family enzyme